MVQVRDEPRGSTFSRVQRLARTPRTWFHLSIAIVALVALLRTFGSESVTPPPFTGTPEVDAQIAYVISEQRTNDTLLSIVGWGFATVAGLGVVLVGFNAWQNRWASERERNVFKKELREEIDPEIRRVQTVAVEVEGRVQRKIDELDSKASQKINTIEQDIKAVRQVVLGRTVSVEGTVEGVVSDNEITHYVLDQYLSEHPDIEVGNQRQFYYHRFSAVLYFLEEDRLVKHNEEEPFDARDALLGWLARSLTDSFELYFSFDIVSRLWFLRKKLEGDPRAKVFNVAMERRFPVVGE